MGRRNSFFHNIFSNKFYEWMKNEWINKLMDDRIAYRTYIGIGLGSLPQVAHHGWTTEPRDLCLSEKSKPKAKVGSSLPLYPSLENEWMDD